MNTRFAVAFASMLCLSGAAVAADLPYKAPSGAVAQKNWTGFYLGLAAGYTSGNVTLGGFANPDASNVHPKGFVFAGLAGYDYQFANNIVVGARVTVPVASVSDQTFSTVAGTDIEGKLKWAVIVSGRLGYAFGNVLPYVTGGFLVARGQATSVGCCSAQATHNGYVVGGGVEYALAPNWSVDVNYSYLSANKADYRFPWSPPAPPLEYGFNSHNILVGVNYRF